MATLAGCTQVGEPPPLIVHIDEGHANHHTAEGRYAPFARLLGDHGIQVERHGETFSEESLAAVGVLVIANAAHPDNALPEQWQRPVRPAFTVQELAALEVWVADGGRLMLIADHMPWPGAATELAARFGFELHDGYLFREGFFDNPLDPAANLIEFHGSASTSRPGDGLLADHPVTRGWDGRPAIPWVTSFTGHGFGVLEEAVGETVALMVVGEGAVQVFPERARDLGPQTTDADLAAMQPTPAAGLLQGALRHYGTGKVAMFGEAGMFTEQDLTAFDPPFPMGKHHPRAPHNGDFALNVIYWLAEDR